MATLRAWTGAWCAVRQPQERRVPQVMNLSHWSLVLAATLGLSAVTLLRSAPVPADVPPARAAGPFDARLREIARTYKSELHASPVDGHMPRWAPLLCRLPIPGTDYLPASARVSASKDEATHGQKLYYLFAKDQLAYLNLTADKPMPPGQFIVKESWLPEEITNDSQVRSLANQHIVEKDGKRFRTGKLAGLYIMLKLAPETPDTDQGWVYGTVTADGKTVTAAGKVESCMSCHVKTAKDRLFGLPEADVKRVKEFMARTKRD